MRHSFPRRERVSRYWLCADPFCGMAHWSWLMAFLHGLLARHVTEPKRTHHPDEIERDAAKLRRAHQVKDGGNLSAHPGTAKRLREGRR